MRSAALLLSLVAVGCGPNAGMTDGDDPDIPPILPVITGTTVLLRLLREELEGLYMQFTDEIKKVEV